MLKEIFEKRKENLFHLAEKYLCDNKIKERDKTALVELLNLLEQYNFDSRLKFKGLLTHTIIDSLEIDYEIGEGFIDFDQSIT